MPEMEQTQGQDAQQTEGQPAPEMCCDGETTAEQHRQESSDGKCCIDK